MDAITLFILIVLMSIGIGILASLFGIGGGFLIVPTMILLIGRGVHLTVGTASYIITFMSLSSLIAYSRQKRIDFIIGGALSLANITGSVLGAVFTEFVTGKFILVMFGLVEATLAIILGTKKTPHEKTFETPIDDENFTLGTKIGKHWFIIKRKVIDKLGIKYSYSANILLAMPFAFLAGFLSSMLGIGGGTLYIQIFVFICGMSIHMAIASSIFMIFFSSLFSTITFAFMGMIDYFIGTAYAVGMIIGAQLGAFISKKIPAKKLKKYAALMIVIIAVRMIIFALMENPAE